MKEVNEDDSLLRRFLLGDMPEEERQRVEESVITDSVYSESVLMAENDLIEDYLEDALSEAERQQFNTHYLSIPQQRRKVRIAESLKKFAAVEEAVHSPAARVENTPHPLAQRKYSHGLTLRKPLVSLALAALLLLAIGLGGWKIVEIQRERERREQAQTRRLAIERELAQLNVPSGNTSPSEGRIFSVDLPPVSVRSADNSGMLSPSAQATVVELRLVLIGEEERSYRASLQKFDSAEQFTIAGLRPENTTGGKVVPVKIPARLLTRGVYQLKLIGETTGKQVDSGEYKFQITTDATR